MTLAEQPTPDELVLITAPATLPARLFTKFAVYLVFRYTLDSYYEGNLEKEQRLWNRSLRLLLLMCVNYERKDGAF